MSIKTVEDLREFISGELMRIKNGESSPANANATANLAGKLISSVKLEMEYNKMIGTQPKIEFLVPNKEEIKQIENIMENQ